MPAVFLMLSFLYPCRRASVILAGLGFSAKMQQQTTKYVSVTGNEMNMRLCSNLMWEKSNVNENGSVCRSWKCYNDNGFCFSSGSSLEAGE